jgi:hypothetical protein
MRNVFSLLCLIALLSLAVPAQAQHRADLPAKHAAVRLFDQGGPSFALNKLFSPEHFQMSHSYEMSMGSFGGNTSSMGMYTNTMQWQFSNKLAARVDVAVAHNLFGGNNNTLNGLGLNQQQGPQVFLRNAEVAYRPTENLQFNFSVRQSPYGSYMSPYGHYGMGYGGFYGMRHSDPFLWDGGRW